MAPKKRTIAAKPDRSKAAPSPDDWVKASTDPELSPVPQAPPPPEAPAEKPPQTFPHRISFDVGGEMYKALKLTALNESRSMNELLRDAVAAYLNK
jgi:hypothetical protein